MSLARVAKEGLVDRAIGAAAVAGRPLTVDPIAGRAFHTPDTEAR